MDGDEQAIAWAEIDRIVDEVRPLLLEDFMRTALDGALRVARDTDNPLRGNLFAGAMREVIGMMLPKPSLALHLAPPGAPSVSMAADVFRNGA